MLEIVGSILLNMIFYHLGRSGHFFHDLSKCSGFFRLLLRMQRDFLAEFAGV